MAKIKDVVSFLDHYAAPMLQESYDNSGLLTGDNTHDVTGVLVSLDCTEKVVEEAIASKSNLIICHHPIIFKGLKSLTGSTYVERTIIKAVKNDIAIFAIHTNLDNVITGVNGKIAELLDLQKTHILAPKMDSMFKLIVFCPATDSQQLISVLAAAGAGEIGNYSECSFRTNGLGTFKGNDQSNPAIGEAGKHEEAQEERIEMIFPRWRKSAVINAIREHHSYEEPAYYIQETKNIDHRFGAGLVGQLPESLEPLKFLEYLKERMNLNVVRYTNFKKPISKIAVCGGAGSFLLPAAITSQADAFVTGDFKYHEFFDAEEKLMICDVGHYESEAFTKELIYDLITGEFNTFAVNLSNTNTNPVNYFY